MPEAVAMRAPLSRNDAGMAAAKLRRRPRARVSRLRARNRSALGAGRGARDAGRGNTPRGRRASRPFSRSGGWSRP